jgi:hypothetical protein
MVQPNHVIAIVLAVQFVLIALAVYLLKRCVSVSRASLQIKDEESSSGSSDVSPRPPSRPGWQWEAVPPPPGVYVVDAEPRPKKAQGSFVKWISGTESSKQKKSEPQVIIPRGGP